MTALHKAAQQALTLLELISQATTKQFGVPLEVVDSLKTALAEPVQEPVAWIGCGDCDCSFPCHLGQARCLRLPPQRKPLTDKEKITLVRNWFAEDWAIKNAIGLLEDYERAIEQAHGIK